MADPRATGEIADVPETARMAVRDAATVILWRSGPAGPEVLMGTRGARAAFMPNKVVFPGGAVDAGDSAVALAGLPDPTCLARLAAHPRAGSTVTPEALLAAAIREVWEETGLRLAQVATGAAGPAWDGFADGGHVPDASALRFVFRAVTPPGRPRRFDARFFLVPASAVAGDPSDLSRTDGELAHLQWIGLDRVRAYDLPFITEVVLAEIGPQIAAGAPVPDSVPVVENDEPVSRVLRLR
ncbi:MAG: NUDIX domain-containing protein [Pseudomonadota bacterium]